ncbi:MAG: HAMP domain-containing histidine kinase [Lachnospiraceae bacterium]|nr:HAMP domain-containing histidine kinase [Lachnospiraceae bacterium]
MKNILPRILNSYRLLKSLKLRIFLVMMIMGILPSLAVGACVLLNYERRAVFEKTVDSTNRCRAMANHIAELGYNNLSDTSEISQELNRLSEFLSARVLVVDRDYKVILDTYSMSVGKTLISKEIVDCFTEGASASNRDRQNQFIELTVPVSDNTEEGQVTGVMITSVPTTSITDSLTVLKRQTRIFEITMAIFTFVISLVLSQILIRPFDRIGRAIGSVREGFDMDPISIPDYLETEAITNAFNSMMSRMKKLDDSRETFVANVSHELKTPLASMKVLSDSILSSGEVPVETYREFMVDIGDEVDRENKIINDLLALVKMDRHADNLNIESCNINETIERILKMVKPIAQVNDIELTFESTREVNAEVDKTKFSLAIMNLVENAIKYNKKEGWVRVKLDADHQLFTVEIADSGVGIPQDSLEHIFERFYRVDKSHSREIGGTGLGLSIARSAILLHRGAIKADSKEGEGTVFTVRVPLKSKTGA